MLVWKMRPTPPSAIRFTMKRGRFIILFLCILGVGCFLFLRSKPDEPAYEGKKLSKWVDLYNEHRSLDRDAENAIRSMGTNALPCMLRWLPQNQSNAAGWKSKLAVGLSRLPRPIDGLLLTLLGVERWPQQVPLTYSSKALICFEIMREKASPAIPNLFRLTGDEGDSETQRRAIMALRFTGHDALPGLYAMLTNRACVNRFAVAEALGEIGDLGDYTHRVVLVMLDYLHDEDIALARASADALGRLKVEPEIVIPALVNGLKNPNLMYVCIRSLGRFGPAARSSVDALQHALAEPNQTFRNEIVESLRDIAPEVVPAVQPGLQRPDGQSEL